MLEQPAKKSELKDCVPARILRHLSQNTQIEKQSFSFLRWVTYLGPQDLSIYRGDCCVTIFDRHVGQIWYGYLAVILRIRQLRRK